MTRYRIATRALIYHPTEKKVFIGQRSDDDKTEPGKWALFGGKVDQGETPKESVIREVLEEAGVKFVPERTFCTHINDNWETHFIIGKVIGETTLDLREHKDSKYVTEIELAELDLAFDHESIIVDFLRSLR